MALRVLVFAALCAGATAQFWPESTTSDWSTTTAATWPTTTNWQWQTTTDWATTTAWQWPTTTAGTWPTTTAAPWTTTHWASTAILPVVPSYSGYSNNGNSGKNFDRRLSSAILDRLFRGRAVKVTVDESRKLSYEQAAEYDTCKQPAQPSTTTPLPAPVLTNYGPNLIDVPCDLTSGPLLVFGFSVQSGSDFGQTFNSAIRGSSNGNFNNYLVGPNNFGYIYLNYQPSSEFSQVIEVWVTNGDGLKSNSIFLTFNFHFCESSTSTPTTITTSTTETPTTSTSTTTDTSTAAAASPYLYKYGNSVFDVPCSLGDGSYIFTPGLSFSTNGVYWHAYNSYSTNGDYNNYVGVLNGGQFYLQSQPNADFTQYVNVYVTNYSNGYSSVSVQLAFDYHSCYSTTTESSTTTGA